MRYETMGKARRQRLNIPQLLGGVNTATEAEFIEDDELADACNLMIDHGTLRTREAVRAVGDEAFWSESEAINVHIDEIVRHPLEIEGIMSMVALSSVTKSKDGVEVPIGTSVDVITLDGEHTHYGTVSSKTNRGAVVPCDEDKSKKCFLVYAEGKVYEADDNTGLMTRVGESKLYKPLVMINGRSTPLKDYDPETYSSNANGVMYEGYNLLTPYCRVSFTPTAETEDANGEIYQLPDDVEQLGRSETITMKVVSAKGSATVTITDTIFGKFKLGDVEYEARFYTNNNIVRIKPSLPVSDVANTVEFTYCKHMGSEPTVFYNCSLATWFGGTANKRGGTRLFLADADNSKLLWSDVNNPFYFPENNYMIVGDASQTITALEKQSDMLVIFKEREIYYTTYVQGEIDTDAVANGTNVDVTAVQAYFPLTQLSPQIGCRCPHSIALCRDRLVWMDEDARIYTLVVSGQYSERNVREIGQKIRPWLLKNTTAQQRKHASAVDHNGKYRLMVGNVMAEFDYNDSGFVNVSSYYSGERAARNIAWMTHCYDFDENAVQTLVSDGADKAIIISTAAEDDRVTRTLYRFDAKEDKDRYLTPVNDGMQAREKEIDVSLTTKTYEFGDPAAYKRIHALYPMLQTDDAEITVIVDGAEPPYGRRYKSADTFAHLVLPGISRCRTFALKLKAIGKLCLKGLRMEYSIFGNVK